MVRLADLPPEIAANLLELPIQDYGPAPWVPATDLKNARVAIISTAGLHRTGDKNFQADPLNTGYCRATLATPTSP